METINTGDIVICKTHLGNYDNLSLSKLYTVLSGHYINGKAYVDIINDIGNPQTYEADKFIQTHKNTASALKIIIAIMKEEIGL